MLTNDLNVVTVQLNSLARLMITRCPYPECLHSFKADCEVLPNDWHWPSGLCPSCSRAIRLRPEVVVDTVERLYEKRSLAGNLQNEPVDNASTAPFSAVVEDVRSLFNVGSIIRTADGAGVTTLYLCGVTGCPPRKEITKASLGAEDSVHWQYHRSLIVPLRELKDRGVQIVGLEKTPQSILFDDALSRGSISAPVCLLVGNEVMGLSAEALSFCDLVCHLPMRGMKESLNVAVAFGIASYSIAGVVLGSGKT